MNLNTELTNSDDDETLSALCGDNSDDSDVTIPYEYASTYKFPIDDHISDLESVEFDADGPTFELSVSFIYRQHAPPIMN